MDGQTLLADLRDESETELSRLGSSKALYALTAGEMDGDAVRGAAAADAVAAADVLETWAETADGPAADTFADAAAQARDHAESLGDPGDGDALDIYGVLADRETPPERAGALLARAVVAGKVAEQMVGFFVGNADPAGADEFRELRGDLETLRERAVDLLDTVCENGADWEAARGAAAAVVEAAYDDYVETLESMGIKPKNVC